MIIIGNVAKRLGKITALDNEYHATMRVYTHLTESREEAARDALAKGVQSMYGGQNGGQTKTL